MTPVVQRVKDVLSYKLDQLLEASIFMKLSSLVAFSWALVMLGGVLVKWHGSSSLSWPHAFFRAYTLLNNAPGVSVVEGETAGALLIANSLFITGIFTFAVALGVVSSGMQVALFRVLAANHRVIEEGHILVLNWSSSLLPVLRQILSAYKDGIQRRPIVVLTAREQAKVRQQLEEELGPVSRRVIVRTGNPSSLRDLIKVSAGQARHILILQPQPDNSTALSSSSSPSSLATWTSSMTFSVEEVRNYVSTQVACVQALVEIEQGGRKLGKNREDVHGIVQVAQAQAPDPVLGFTFLSSKSFEDRVLTMSAMQPGIAEV